MQRKLNRRLEKRVSRLLGEDLDILKCSQSEPGVHPVTSLKDGDGATGKYNTHVTRERQKRHFVPIYDELGNRIRDSKRLSKSQRRKSAKSVRTQLTHSRCSKEKHSETAENSKIDPSDDDDMHPLVDFSNNVNSDEIYTLTPGITNFDKSEIKVLAQLDTDRVSKNEAVSVTSDVPIFDEGNDATIEGNDVDDAHMTDSRASDGKNNKNNIVVNKAISQVDGTDDLNSLPQSTTGDNVKNTNMFRPSSPVNTSVPDLTAVYSVRPTLENVSNTNIGDLMNIPDILPSQKSQRAQITFTANSTSTIQYDDLDRTVGEQPSFRDAIVSPVPVTPSGDRKDDTGPKSHREMLCDVLKGIVHGQVKVEPRILRIYMNSCATGE